jgi:hypothetical protein
MLMFFENICTSKPTSNLSSLPQFLHVPVVPPFLRTPYPLTSIPPPPPRSSPSPMPLTIHTYLRHQSPSPFIHHPPTPSPFIPITRPLPIHPHPPTLSPFIPIPQRPPHSSPYPSPFIPIIPTSPVPISLLSPSPIAPQSPGPKCTVAFPIWNCNGKCK